MCGWARVVASLVTACESVGAVVVYSVVAEETYVDVIYYGDVVDYPANIDANFDGANVAAYDHTYATVVGVSPYFGCGITCRRQTRCC